MGAEARAQVAHEILRQRMLGVIAEANASGGYIASWSIDHALGGNAYLWVSLASEANDVLRELVADGLIEELTDLHCHYQLRRQSFESQ